MINRTGDPSDVTGIWGRASSIFILFIASNHTKKEEKELSNINHA